MTQPRLVDVPVDPDTLTDRQQAALEIVRAGTGDPYWVGRKMGTHAHWAKTAGLSVLRELHRKGLVRRVGHGGGRWALVEGGRAVATESAEQGADSAQPCATDQEERALVEGAARTTPGGAAAPASSASAQGDFPEGF